MKAKNLLPLCLGATVGYLFTRALVWILQPDYIRAPLADCAAYQASSEFPSPTREARIDELQKRITK